MSDNDFTKAIQEIRQAINDIKEDVQRIEQRIGSTKPHRWYPHLPLMRKYVRYN
jgi:hypothetical protein